MRAALSLTDKNYKQNHYDEFTSQNLGNARNDLYRYQLCMTERCRHYMRWHLVPWLKLSQIPHRSDSASFEALMTPCNYAYITLRDKHSAEWILESDIKACLITFPTNG